MKKTYEMNGKQYNTMMAMAKELGVKRIYAKDFAKYGITEVTVDDSQKDDVKVAASVDTQDTVDDVTTDEVDDNETADDNKDTEVEDKKDSQKKDNKKAAPAKKVAEPKKTGTAADIAEVEKNVVDMDANQLGKAVTNFTTKALETMVKNVDGNLYEGITHEGIRKMRLIMELKKAYFPNEVRKAAPQSPWKAIDTTKLEKAAKKAKANVVKCDNIGIYRMRLIMALKKAGVDATAIK